MIDTAIKFLRDQLNAALRLADAATGVVPQVVTFVKGDNIGDSVSFELGKVSALLVKLEEENALRSAEPFARTTANGAHHRVSPEIRLNMFVLFVAHFKDYADSLRLLSEIVAYFQNHRVFTPVNAPTLDPTVDQLAVELVTLPFSEQNEIWGALRTSYRPSALYRVRMVVFRDRSLVSQPSLDEVQINLSA